MLAYLQVRASPGVVPSLVQRLQVMVFATSQLRCSRRRAHLSKARQLLSPVPVTLLSSLAKRQPSSALRSLHFLTVTVSSTMRTASTSTLLRRSSSLSVEESASMLRLFRPLFTQRASVRGAQSAISLFRAQHRTNSTSTMQKSSLLTA